MINDFTPNFGNWVDGVLRRGGKEPKDLVVATKKQYSYLNRLINSGRRGKPIRPDLDVAQQIGEGLVNLGLLGDAREAVLQAGYVPDGYIAVRADQSHGQRMVAAEKIIDAGFPHLPTAVQEAHIELIRATARSQDKAVKPFDIIDGGQSEITTELNYDEMGSAASTGDLSPSQRRRGPEEALEAEPIEGEQEIDEEEKK